MGRKRRIAMGLLALLLLFGAMPVMGQKAVAATPVCFDETPFAILPVKYLYVARTNDKLDPDQEANASDSGHRQYAWDLNMKNATKKQRDWNVYAPFDLKVVSTGATHSVIVESLTPVRLANGQVDYVTCIVTHMDDISKIKVGAVYKKGTAFYQMGTYGSTDPKTPEHVGAFDRHLHIEVAIGRVCSSKKSFSQNMKLVRSNGVQINEVFFLEPETPVKKDYIDYNGYKIYLGWKTRKEVTFHSDTADLVREYVVNEAFGSLPTPVKAGKEFDGWYTAQTGGTKVTGQTLVTKTGQTELYARWKETEAPVVKGVASKAQAGATDAKIALMTLREMFTKNARGGYYLGTNPQFLTKSARTKKLNGQDPVVFQVSKDGFALQPSTTYYYQPYAILNGKEVRGEVASFTTTAATAQSSAAAQIHALWRDQKASGTTVSATVSYGKSVKPEKHGLYLGTNKNMLSKTAVYQNLGANAKSTNISYNLTQKGVELLPGTTYYYQFYVVVNGREYKSGIRSFKTSGTAPENPPQQTTPEPTEPQDTKPQELRVSWSGYGLSGVTQTDAAVSAKATYNRAAKPEKFGLYGGTKQGSMPKVYTADTSGTQSSTQISCKASQWGVDLKPGTTYYYQFFVVVEGKEYKSEVKSLTTLQEAKPTKLNPVWSDYKVSGVTKTDATISAKVTYGKTVTLQKAGFYIGTAKDKLTKADKFDTSGAKWNYTQMSFNLNKYGVSLKAGTTYYYQFYVIVDGQEYKSDVKSFTTEKAPALAPVWSNYKASSITKTNATISAKVTYGKTITLQKAGFYIGTAKDKLTKADKFDTSGAKWNYTQMSFNLNKYGVSLKAGTTYYYQFYVIVDGQEYKSDVKSFTTKK